MPSHPFESASGAAPFFDVEPVKRSHWGPVVVSVLVLFWFYGFEARYGAGRGQSALDWLWSAWNGENDYEHGPLFPLIIAGLVAYRCKNLKAAAGKGSALGVAGGGGGRVALCRGLPHAPAAGRDRSTALSAVGVARSISGAGRWPRSCFSRCFSSGWPSPCRVSSRRPRSCSCWPPRWHITVPRFAAWRRWFRATRFRPFTVTGNRWKSPKVAAASAR